MHINRDILPKIALKWQHFAKKCTNRDILPKKCINGDILLKTAWQNKSAREQSSHVPAYFAGLQAMPVFPHIFDTMTPP